MAGCLVVAEAGFHHIHLRHLVFWNFNHGGDEAYYHFWQGYIRFLHPIIVGFHGNPATFEEGTLEVLESNGEVVDPESLFEAQLELRLGNFAGLGKKSTHRVGNDSQHAAYNLK